MRKQVAATLGVALLYIQQVFAAPLYLDPQQVMPILGSARTAGGTGGTGTYAYNGSVMVPYAAGNSTMTTSPMSVRAGDLLVVFCTTYVPGVLLTNTITNSASDTFSLVVSSTLSQDVATDTMRWAKAKSTGSYTFTCTPSQTGSGGRMIAMDFGYSGGSGPQPDSSFTPVTAGSLSSVTSLTSSSFTVPANDYVLACSNGSGSGGYGASMTIAGNSSISKFVDNGYQACYGYAFATAQTAATATMTFNFSQAAYLGLAVFK